MYVGGEGAPQNYSEAMKWFMLAAEQGDAKAQVRLGFMYYNIQGVPQDYALAYMWFYIAAANRSDLGSELRDSVAAEMTAEDISKAQSMAKECLANDYKNCGG